MPIVSTCVAHLSRLPFVHHAEVDSTGSLTLRTPDGPALLALSVDRSFLSDASVSRLISDRTDDRMVFAPLVSGELARRLQDAGINYVDPAGNLHIALGDRYVAHIEGKTLQTPTRPAGIRSAGYRVLFALMAWPKLAGRSQREISVHAGTSRTAVAALLSRLEVEGALLGRGAQRRLVLSPSLLQRWRVGYSDVLRPSMFIARYRLPDGGLAPLERRLAHTVGDRFSWGGGVAAARLGGTFIGERVTLHVRQSDASLPLTRAPDGSIHVLSTPGPLAWPGSAVWDGGGVQAIHPLLAYAELLDSGSDRALGAARELQDQYGWATS